jgi:hypothetical protein
MKMIENLAPWSPLAPPKRQKIAPRLSTAVTRKVFQQPASRLLKNGLVLEALA